MANILAAQSGNWSNSATWIGGVLPGVDDIVYANSFVVTIDQDVSCVALSARSENGALVGGQFVVSDTGGTAITLTFSEGLGDVVNLRVGQPNVPLLVVSASDGEVIVNSSIKGGSGGTWWFTLHHSGTCTLSVIGDVEGGTSPGVNAYGIYSTNSGVINITGQVRGAPGINSNNVGIEATSNASIFVFGSVVGSTVRSTCYGIRSLSPITLTVTGAVIGMITEAVYVTNASAVIDLQGPIIASTSAAGAYLVGPTTVRVKGPLVHHEGTSRAPLVATFFAFHENEQTSWTIMDDTNYPAGNPVVLSNYVTNSPPPADVRSGTIYGPESALVGTLDLPQPEQVASGVGVDATEGTAAVRLSDVAAITGSQIAATFD